jgi:hypothetical protein
MYFPKSQIKPNLYTNGGEYILSTTKSEYKGYYYEISSGKKYTGKTPQDGPNILLLISTITLKPIPSNLEPSSNTIFPTDSPNPIIYSTDPFNETISKTLPNRYLPQFNPTLPTTPDKNLGVFSRYFCKKNNELIYLEIDKQTFTDLSSRSPKIAWDLYTPLTTVWYIKGNKETTYKANKGLISVIEQRQKWYGFSKYLKEDYLKYYLGE